jgi:hypothetical protein
MRTTLKIGSLIVAAQAALSVTNRPAAAIQEAQVPDTAKLEQMAARFAPTDIGADLSKLPAADRRVVAKLVEASKIVDALFFRQVWAGNDAALLDLVKDPSPGGRARLHYFLINKGPWSRLDHNAPFVRPTPRKRISSAGLRRCRRQSGRARPGFSR